MTNVSRKTTDEIMQLERIIFKTKVPSFWELIGRHEVGEIFLRKTFVKNWSICYVDTDMTRVIWRVAEQLKSVRTKNNATEETLNSKRTGRDGFKIGQSGARHLQDHRDG